MNRKTLGIAAAIVIVALVSLGVIDKDTAQKLLSGQAQSESVSKPPVPSVSPASASKSTSPEPRKAAETQWHGWSKTDPQVNLSHIFAGEINRQGKPTGFHSRPNARDPEHARLVRIKSPPNRAGVYTAQVEVYDPGEKRWKSKFSTFFPDRMSRQEVLDSILHAWKKRQPGQSKPWRGPSGRGFQVEGYRSNRGGINTAYPIYQR